MGAKLGKGLRAGFSIAFLVASAGHSSLAQGYCPPALSAGIDNEEVRAVNSFYYKPLTHLHYMLET